MTQPFQPQRIVPPPVKGEPMNLKRWWETASTTARALFVAVVASFFMCGCVSAIAVSAASSGTHPTTQDSGLVVQKATSTPLPTATQEPTATATPKPTPNPNAGYAAYASIVKTDANTMSADFSSVSSSCGASDIEGCRSDLTTLQGDIHSFQSDLNAHPAPPCLASVDKDLRASLKLYDQGAQSTIDGIDQLDPSLIQTGSSDFSQATTKMQSATSGIYAAHC